MAGFPVYMTLHLVISITTLPNVHPRTAALWYGAGGGGLGR